MSLADTNEPKVLVLHSCTVFSEDLGISRSKWRNDLAMQNEIQTWLETNVVRHYNIYESGVWFYHPNDAALFKIAFSGRYNG